MKLNLRSPTVMLGSAFFLTVLLLGLTHRPSGYGDEVRVGWTIPSPLAGAMANGPLGATKEAAIVVLADPSCAHCQNLVATLWGVWEKERPANVHLVFVFDAAPSTGDVPDGLYVSPDVQILIDSTGALRRGIVLKYIPLTLGVDPDSRVVTSTVGSVSRDSLQHLISELTNIAS